IDQRKEPLDKCCGALFLILFHAIGFDMAGAFESLAQQRRELPYFGLCAGGPPAGPPTAPQKWCARHWGQTEREKEQGPTPGENPGRTGRRKENRRYRYPCRSRQGHSRRRYAEEPHRR